MNFDVNILLARSRELIIPLSVFVVLIMASLALRKVVFSRLSAWTKHTKTQIDDIIAEAIRGPFLVWCFMLSTYITLEISPVSEEIVNLVGKVLLVLGIGSVTFVAANISSQFIRTYSTKIESTLPVTSLTQNLTRIVVFAVGLLIILNSLGISITPILATLGVGGLAVALALQDTLSNLFSGLHIIMAKQVKIGDYVRLESGEEGYVTDINWRTTRVRMLPNNVVLVPNAKLAQAIIVNYYLPEKEMAVLVNLGVHYDSDLKKVEKVTVEVAKEVMRDVTGAVSSFEPFIRYHTFGDFSINFTVILRAKEFVDQYLIKHEFVKRLHERYGKEGIIIPYPIRAINYEQEKKG